jgi:phage terminase large subunit-like protein
MTAEFREALASSLETGWRVTARPNQLPPAGDDWFIWLLLAGRGFGKTRALVEYALDRVATGAAQRIALVAATAADCRDVLVEGASGILTVAPDWCRPVYEPSKRRLTWPNGAIGTCYSADEPERLRGPQHDLAIVDELGSWRRPEAWDNLLFGLRLGERPRIAVATTPRPTRLIRDLVSRDDGSVVISRGSSYENRDNLAADFFGSITRKYAGTRLGRQELMGELLTDTPGALWTLDRIEELRRDSCPTLQRIVVAIDPSGSGSEDADECGIVAAGLDQDGAGWILADASGRFEPTQWAKIAIELYHRLGADRIVAEVNYGGEMVQSTLRAIDPNAAYRAVTASRGKVARAEPIAALYEQKKVHHLGSFPELEDQMSGFTSNFDPKRAGYSPGRVDALVWALTDLMAQPMKGWAIFEVTRQRALGIPYVPRRRIEEFRAGPTTAAPDTRTAERRTYEQILNRPTPLHPEDRGGPVEHVNGPKAKLTYAPGSLEFEQQQKEKSGA